MRALLRKAGVGKFLLNYVITPAQKLGELKYPDKDVSVKVGDHTLTIFSPRKNRIGRALYKDRIWEPEVTTVIQKNTQAGMVALDVGADIGYYTVNLAQRVGPQGRVIAFEPIPEARKHLEQNISGNGYKNITVCPYALGNQDGIVYLEDPLKKSRISLTKSENGSNSANDIKVTIKKLDDIIKSLGVDRIDIIKMDIEGAEHEALRGMEQSLRKYKPLLVIEVHHEYLPFFNSTADAVQEWLKGVGYSLELIDEGEIDLSHVAKTFCCRFNSN